MTKHWEHPHFSYAEQIAFLIAKYDEPIICDDDMSAERCRLNCILHGKNPDPVTSSWRQFAGSPNWERKIPPHPELLKSIPKPKPEPEPTPESEKPKWEVFHPDGKLTLYLDGIWCNTAFDINKLIAFRDHIIEKYGIAADRFKIY